MLPGIALHRNIGNWVGTCTVIGRTPPCLPWRPPASRSADAVGFGGRATNVQHIRSASSNDDWPLVQVGPGIFAVNDTHRYAWTDFQQRAKEAVVRLYDAHPSVAEFHIQSLVLRYIDAVEYNYEDENAFTFLRDKMKLGISLPDSLFQNTSVESRPQSFLASNVSVFQTARQGSHQFCDGQKEDKSAILWETTVQSAGDDLPNMPDGFPDWFDAAHEITDDWFFKLIEGELERRFEGE